MPSNTPGDNGGLASLPKLKNMNMDLQPNKAPLSMLCEWGECNEIFDNMLPYREHVKHHLWEVFDTLKEVEGDNCELTRNIACDWKDCGQEIGRGFPELVRHVYFHAFHARLKNVGAYVTEMRQAPPCLLDGSTRNMIPELPERLCCAWDKCGAVYDDPSLFYEHANSHIGEITEKKNETANCKWEGCEFATKTRHRMREHMRSHTQERIAACHNCGALFSSNTKLLDHMLRQKDATMAMFQCSHCSKAYTTERLLRDHMRHHVNHYKCPLCDMTCPSPSTLRNHIYHRHNEDRPHICTYCGASFKLASDLRRHEDTHAAGKFHCYIDKCEYKCNSYKLLHSHFKSVHEGEERNRYKCHLCGEEYVRGYLLTQHLKKKHNFQWPGGHHRFRYKLNTDGYYKLQTVRYESLELTEQLLTDNMSEDAPQDLSVHKDKFPKKSRSNLRTPMKRPNTSKEPMKKDLSYNLQMLGDVALQQEANFRSMPDLSVPSGSGENPADNSAEDSGKGDGESQADNNSEVEHQDTVWQHSMPSHSRDNMEPQKHRCSSPASSVSSVASSSITVYDSQYWTANAKRRLCMDLDARPASRDTRCMSPDADEDLDRLQDSPRKRKLATVINDPSNEKTSKKGNKSKAKQKVRYETEDIADGFIYDDNETAVEITNKEHGYNMLCTDNTNAALEVILPDAYNSCDQVLVEINGDQTMYSLSETPLVIYGSESHQRKQNTPVKVVSPDAM